MLPTYPVNQVFLGGEHYNPNVDLDTQIQNLKLYEEKLKNMRNKNTYSEPTLWDKIDNEVSPLTTDQKESLFKNQEYLKLSEAIHNMVQVELLNLVKNKIEKSKDGESLLTSQLDLIKRLKSNIIEESNREMEMFKKFKDYSKNNPDVTYEAFIKSNI